MSYQSIQKIRSGVIALLGIAALSSVCRAQTTDGTLVLQSQSYGTSYELNVFEDSSQWGTEFEAAGVQQLSAGDLVSASLGLVTSSFYAFSIELGQGAPVTATPYQIFGAGSLAYADSTGIVGTPGFQANESAFEMHSGVGSTTGISSYRADQLELLYGYAFGKGGVFNFGSGYAPAGLSAVDQLAFQLAVWKLSHEGSPSDPASQFKGPQGGISCYGFSVDADLCPNVVSEANALLAAVAADCNITPMALDALNNGSSQDYLVPADSFTQVPEPALTSAAVGLSALGFALFARFRLVHTPASSI
jgi:hypothetical protein